MGESGWSKVPREPNHKWLKTSNQKKRQSWTHGCTQSPIWSNRFLCPKPNDAALMPCTRGRECVGDNLNCMNCFERASKKSIWGEDAEDMDGSRSDWTRSKSKLHMSSKNDPWVNVRVQQLNAPQMTNRINAGTTKNVKAECKRRIFARWCEQCTTVAPSWSWNFFGWCG